MARGNGERERSGASDEAAPGLAGPRRALARSVVLIGLMGAGKSAIGARLATAIGAEFRDSDSEIEAAAAMSIPEIFEAHGEGYFRAGERRVIARLLSEAPQVISTGGGAFLDAETRRVIRARACSVWLRADLDTLVQRTAGRSHRPLLNRGDPRATLARLIEARYPVYAKAEVVVDSVSGQPHEEMVARLIAALEAAGRVFRPG
ncbi:MAG: shikimate kinase [Pseudomonadota bacterium]